MVYNITTYDGQPLVSIPDSSINTTATSIALLGRNAVNFGLPLNENFIALMQHFASNAPPPNPLVGQIWWDTIISAIKIWTGTQWQIMSPPFDGDTGTAIVSVSPTQEVGVYLNQGHIIAAVSHSNISPGIMPVDVVIADVTYPFSARFPNGINAGITLATDPTGYYFGGTAFTANVLTTSRNIALTGSVVGNVNFDGGNNVVISTQLPSVFNVNISPGYYTNVFVNSNGLVTDGKYLVDNDIYDALGYTPPSEVVINGDASGNTSSNGTVFTVTLTLSNTNVTPGVYNGLTIDGTGRVTDATDDLPVPITGIILIDNAVIPNNWAECNGQTVTTPQGIINTPNLVANYIGTTKYIMRIS